MNRINQKISKLFALCFGCSCAILLYCSLSQAADLSGVPRIVDGDTLAISSTKVRLEGIDAPETDQVCLNASGAHWAGGSYDEAHWPEAEFIIGNPPFLGSRKMQPELGADYVKVLRSRYDGRVPVGADLVCY